MHTKPDCKHLTEPTIGTFHCVHRRLSAPPHIKKIHLTDCTSCKLQEHIVNASKTQQPVVYDPAKVGELPPQEDILPVEFTPIKDWRKIINYVRADGAKICPFEHNQKLCFVYHFNCVACKKSNPEKFEACLTLHALPPEVTTPK